MSRLLLLSGVVFAVCCLIYLNSINNQFLMDDPKVIAQNQLIRDPTNIGTILFSDYLSSVPEDISGRLYRPIPMLSYAVNYWIGGLSVKGYHIVNILLHGVVALLVMWLCLILFGNLKISFFVALLFVAHPINTEAVVEIVNRADLLAAGFFVLSLIYYIKCQRQSQRGKRYYLLALLFFFLALLSKENAVTLVGVIFLTDLVFHLKTRQGFLFDIKQVLQDNFFRRYLGFIIVLVGYLLIRMSVLGGIGLSHAASILDNPIASASFLAGRLTAVKVFWKYICLLIFPLHLSCDYSYNQIPVAQSLFEPQLIAGFVLLLSLVLLLVVTYRRTGKIFFSLMFFAATFLIVSNLIVVIGTIMGERLLYIPSLGFCILLAMGLSALPSLAKRTETKKMLSVLAIVLLVTIMVLYCVRTVVRNNDWQDDFTLYIGAAKACPNSARVWNNLGSSYGSRKYNDEAVASLERAVSIFPQYTTAWFNLSRAYEQAGLLEKAIASARRVTELNPSHAKAYQRQGKLLIKTGAYEEALAALKKAQESDPMLHSVYAAMAELYFQQGQFDLAENSLQKAITIAPQTFEYYKALGRIYETRGQMSNMENVLKQMVELWPDSAEVHRNLGIFYANQSDKYQIALSYLEQSIELEPNQPGIEKIQELIRTIQMKLQRHK
jgi:tetratricopeptide (TPR) repeat protein